MAGNTAAQGEKDASSTQGTSIDTPHHWQNNWSAEMAEQKNKLPLKDHSVKINIAFPTAVYRFFFIEEKFRSCVSSSFFCHKRGKIFKLSTKPYWRYSWLTKTSFFYSWPDITLSPHGLTALSLCSSPWALPKPVHKPFLAELSICITGDSVWQKPQMPEAPEFWLPRGTPRTE